MKQRVFKGKTKILMLLAVFAITAATFSQSVYAMPSYGFGATENSDTTVYFDVGVSNANNQDAWASSGAFFAPQPARDAVHMDISVMGTAQQNIPQNSERIGTLTVPSGRQIGVYGGESLRSMEKGAAHFSDTGLNWGNTAVIGHNRGSNGHFGFVKNLETGQILTLEANGVTKIYTVADMYKIHATETALLMQYGDSRLTLVTCWEGEKDYRRVVIAYEF